MKSGIDGDELFEFQFIDRIARYVSIMARRRAAVAGDVIVPLKNAGHLDLWLTMRSLCLGALMSRTSPGVQTCKQTTVSLAYN